MKKAVAIVAGVLCLSCACSRAPVGRPGTIQAGILIEDGGIGVTNMEKIVKSDAEWKKILTPEQYRITRRRGTEAPFCGGLLDNKEPGVYACVCCGLPLFSAVAKFESGTGWPSFFKPIAPENVAIRTDRDHGMVRTEILCARCDAHLGHVFDDGPKPTGLRYCLNSVSLKFIPRKDSAVVAATPEKEKATFAAGCFWGVEEVFRTIPGVISTTVGYTGGRTENPTYEEVCTDRTGHAEAVEVVYDPAVITYAQLLRRFFEYHDPTTIDRQGPDIGTQYRSAIFYHSPAQREAATAAKAQLEKSKMFRRPIATAIEPAATFYPAEEYHQKYFLKQGHPGCHARLQELDGVLP